MLLSILFTNQLFCMLQGKPSNIRIATILRPFSDMDSGNLVNPFAWKQTIYFFLKILKLIFSSQLLPVHRQTEPVLEDDPPAEVQHRWPDGPGLHHAANGRSSGLKTDRRSRTWSAFQQTFFFFNDDGCELELFVTDAKKATNKFYKMKCIEFLVMIKWIKVIRS